MKTVPPKTIVVYRIDWKVILALILFFGIVQGIVLNAFLSQPKDKPRSVDDGYISLKVNGYEYFGWFKLEPTRQGK